MTLDGHIIKFILRSITLFFNPRQPSLRKVQMERHTLPTGVKDSSMGPNSLCGYIVRKILGICFKRTYTPEDKLRDDNFPNGGGKINTLP